jgi:hypothetical protein
VRDGRVRGGRVRDGRVRDGRVRGVQDDATLSHAPSEGTSGARRRRYGWLVPFRERVGAPIRTDGRMRGHVREVGRVRGQGAG